MKQRIITNIAVAADGVQIDFVQRDEMREPGYMMTRAIVIPAKGEVGDRMDRLMHDAELLLDLALSEFDSATPVEDSDVEARGIDSTVEGLESEVSPWDNPEERDITRASLD